MGDQRDDRAATAAARRDRRVPFSRCAAIVLALMVTALSAVVAAPAHASFWDGDATPLWANYADGPGSGDDYAVGVELASGGVAYVAGVVLNAQGNTDLSLGKYVAGVDAWGGLKRYDGPAHGNDWATSMALGPGGVVYVAGASTRSTGVSDIVLVKWSGKTGKRLWVRRYDGPRHLNDVASAVGVDRWGNVTVAGYSRSGNGEDVLVRSWSAAGVVRWTWRYDGAAHGDDWANDLVVGRDGSVYVNASVRGAGDLRTSLTTRRSRAGATKWLDLYVDPESFGISMRALAARPGGGVYVGGAEVTAASANDGVVVGYAASGSRVYIAHDGGAGDQGFNDIAVTSTGEVVTAGYTIVGGDIQPRYVRFDLEGTPAGSGTITTSGTDEFFAVATDAFGGYYLSGTNTDTIGRQRIETRRLTGTAGGGLWLSEMLPFPTGGNYPSAVDVRGATVAVAGAVNTGGATDDDQFVFTYVY